jgi:hypothetical protein
VCGVFVQAPLAWAQHGGHVGGAPHVSAPPMAHAPIAHGPVSHAPIGRPHVPVAPPVGGIGVHGYRLPPWRVRPAPPVFIYPYPVFWGWPYYGFGWGWGWNPYACWSWANCDLFWNWGLFYNAPFYSYGSYVAPSYAAPPSYAYPVYEYGAERNDLPQLFLNDGTVYNVTDYWLVDGQMHFKVLENGKPVEHVVNFDEVDLQRTIDVATQRGFRFVLRNEPLEEYLKHDRELAPPERK